MNFVNGLATKLFDLLMTPLEYLGLEVLLVIVSGIFGVLGLLVFKHISWQKGIATTKDKIKGHMIEIRIYQDDLVVVGKAVAKVLMRNLQYLALNIGPFVPLSIPFVILLSQLVVRYAFEPLPVDRPFTLTVELDEANAAQVKDLVVEAPDWVSQDELVVVRAPSEGRAFVSVRDAQEGVWDFRFRVGSGVVASKQVVIGHPADPPRHMQPERVGSFWEAWLWPAEDTLDPSSSIHKISIVGGYPQHAFAFLPDGILGLLVGVILYSFVFGILALKPLGVTI